MTLRTIVDGQEETISEYLCDWPECPRIAATLLGAVPELGARAMVCAEHAAQIAKQAENRRQ